MLADSNKTVALHFVLAHRLGAFHRVENLADSLDRGNIVIDHLLKQDASALLGFL